MTRCGVVRTRSFEWLASIVPTLMTNVPAPTAARSVRRGRAHEVETVQMRRTNGQKTQMIKVIFLYHTTTTSLSSPILNLTWNTYCSYLKNFRRNTRRRGSLCRYARYTYSARKSHLDRSRQESNKPSLFAPVGKLAPIFACTTLSGRTNTRWSLSRLRLRSPNTVHCKRDYLPHAMCHRMPALKPKEQLMQKARRLSFSTSFFLASRSLLRHREVE
jgi:hypothetical protein